MRHISLRAVRLGLGAGLLLATLSSAAFAETALTAPQLQAAHNAGQGWLPRLTRTLVADGVRDLRAGIYWRNVERAGTYVFDDPTTTYPDALSRAGAGMTLTLNAGHPEYDDGHTPHSAEAVAAMAAYAAAAVRRFPAIHTVEVGNEVNAGNFVSGPVHAAGIEARARYHLAILRAVYDAVKAERPGVRVLGGSAHSISGRYLGDVFARAGAEVMDALALHPYTTPIDLMQREIAYLRRLPGAADIAIEITEFGYDGPERPAADHLLRSYCAFALSDVHKVTWYPLHPRGDGYAPLYTERGQRTQVGAAYHLVLSELAGRPVRDAADDAFTRGCAFGPSEAPTHIVLWGAPRALSLAAGVLARDATGAPATPTQLSPDVPILLSRADGGPVRLGEHVRLAPQTRRADSAMQFDLPRDREARAPADAFERVLRTGGIDAPLVTRPGQETDGVPWRPYRASQESTFPRLTEDYLMTARGPRGPVDIVHRYHSDTAEALLLDLRLDPWEGSSDGVTLSIRAGDRTLYTSKLTEPLQLRQPIDLAAGAALEIAVGPGHSAEGDYVEYRIILEAR